MTVYPAPTTTSDGIQSIAQRAAGVSHRLLPVDYKPSDYTVILGRGKKIKNHKGNLRLDALVQEQLFDYTSADSKTTKSFILLNVLNQVQSNNADQVGFVKQEGGSSATKRWFAVDHASARATVAQAFRDANHVQYRSSKQSKQRRRLIEREGDEKIGVASSPVNDLGAADDFQPLSLTEVMRAEKQSRQQLEDGTCKVGSSSMWSAPFSFQDFDQQEPVTAGSSGILGSSNYHDEQQGNAVSRIRGILNEVCEMSLPCDIPGGDDEWDTLFDPLPAETMASFLNPTVKVAHSSAYAGEVQNNDDDALFQVFDDAPVHLMRDALGAPYGV